MMESKIRQPLLQMDEVTKSLGKFELGPINLNLDTGVTALLGANGAGKTTLMRLIVGASRVGSGEILYGGDRGGQGKTGYLPQEFVGPSHVRVGDYLRFVAWCRSRKEKSIGEIEIRQTLQDVHLLDSINTKMGDLSGGMMRRVGIAQALLGKPRVLVLDEPTVGLDPVQRRELRQLLMDLGKENSVIVSTHLSEDVSAAASKVAVLNSGRLIFEGKTRELSSFGGFEEQSSESVEAGYLKLIGADKDPT